MLLFSLFASSSFTAGAAITGTLHPLALTFGRFAVAGGIFFPVPFAPARLPQATVMASTSLFPVFVVLMDGLARGVWPSPSVLAGVAVIAAAMLVLESG
jgi:drug/metabolite transporter (DMT)-like permease